MDDTSSAATLCFIDTETTSLRPDRRAWEIAVIARKPDQPDAEYLWFVAAGDLDLGNADLAALRVGRFHERHPDYGGPDYSGELLASERAALEGVEEVTRGAHLVGAVVSFDAEVLAARMRARGIVPSWHYHVLDVEALAAGYLRGQGRPVPPLPWRSDELSRLAGVEPPGDDERHTALGDARWAARIWAAVTGATP